MYEYACKVLKIVDGDTVDCEVDLGFTVKVEVRFRLAGINAPEVKGESKDKGLATKNELKRLLSLGPVLVKSLKPVKTDKYGRWLGTFYVQQADASINVNQLLVETNFAVHYLD